MTLKKVVLPAPLGPISPYTCPRSMVSPTSDSACNPPKRLEMPATRSTTSAISGSLPGCGRQHLAVLARRPQPAWTQQHDHDHRQGDEELAQDGGIKSSTGDRLEIEDTG